jgi:hypothetical protein
LATATLPILKGGEPVSVGVVTACSFRRQRIIAHDPAQCLSIIDQCLQFSQSWLTCKCIAAILPGGDTVTGGIMLIFQIGMVRAVRRRCQRRIPGPTDF